LQANAKVLEGTQHPDRNAQFQYPNEQVKQFLAAGQPIVSMDAKKKELVGEFKNGTWEWQRVDLCIVKDLTAVACDRAGIDHIVGLRLRVVPERTKRTFFCGFSPEQPDKVLSGLSLSIPKPRRAGAQLLPGRPAALGSFHRGTSFHEAFERSSSIGPRVA
jgi:hypothetical protein